MAARPSIAAGDRLVRALLAELVKGSPAQVVKRLGLVGGTVVALALWYDSVEELKSQVQQLQSTQEILLYYAVFEHGDIPHGPLSDSQRAVLLRLLKEGRDGAATGE